RGCADLRGEVRQRADVVAEDRSCTGELGASELHTVAGVAGEPDRCSLEVLDGEFLLLRRRHPPSGCLIFWCGRGGRLSSSSGNDSARYLMMSTCRITPTSRPPSSTTGTFRYRPVCIRSIASRMVWS